MSLAFGDMGSHNVQPTSVQLLHLQFFLSIPRHSRGPCFLPFLASQCYKLRSAYNNPERVATMMFHVSLEQAEDGWVVAEVPALPGCVSQGRDEKEALENIKEAITAWLWAEDQKAMQSMKPQQTQFVVAV